MNDLSFKISVVIPIYKVELYIRECIDSVLRQSYKNIEIILVDDGSPDACPQICDEYALLDDRIKVIHKKNGGLSDARNQGLKMASGEYVIFLDSDDFWIGDSALEEIVNLLNFNPDIVYFDRITYYENGSIVKPIGFTLSEINHKDKNIALSELISHGKFIVSACNKCVKRDILEKNKIWFTTGLYSEDIDWNFAVTLVANKLFAIDTPIYGYRRRENSISSSIGKKNIQDLLFIIEKWSAYFLSDKKIDFKQKELLLGYCNYQYNILLGLLNSITKSEQKDLLPRIKSLKFLLKYDVNKKTHLTFIVYRFWGFKICRYVLSFYIRLKEKGYKIQ